MLPAISVFPFSVDRGSIVWGEGGTRALRLWAWVLAPFLTSCVTSSTLLLYFVQLSYLQNGFANYRTYCIGLKDEMIT